MKKLYFAIAFAAMLTACSEDFNPDVDLKGEVDGSYLTQLEQGQASATFLHNNNETRVYSRQIIDSVSTSKWSEITDQVDTSERLRRVDIHDGKSWVPYQPAPTVEEMVLFEPEIEVAWKEYLTKSGFDTTQCIVYPFVYNAETQQVSIDDVLYTVERANNERLLISINKKVSDTEEQKYVYTFFQSQDFISWNAANWDQYYSKKKAYDSPKDLIIARIDIMKEYNKGNGYWTYSPSDTENRYLNLDLVKQLIEEGRTYETVTNAERVLLFGRPVNDNNDNNDNSDNGDNGDNNENNE